MTIPHQYTVLAATLFSLVGCNNSLEPQTAADQTSTEKLNRLVHVVELKDSAHLSTKIFTGKLQSAETAGVAFRVPGTIQNILVKTGETVKKGQPIAQLDPHDYHVALEELQARALEAKSAHKLAKAELARVKQAIADDAIASVNLDRAISGYERSESAVKVVGQNIRRAKDMIRYTRLLAPFDGVIAASNFDQFEQVLPGIAVFTIHKPDELEVKIDVPENLIHQFKSGQSANISWYQSDTPLIGYAEEISSLPHPIKQTYSVTYRLNIQNDQGIGISEHGLLPGKAVTLSTQLGEANSNHCLPYSSLVSKEGIDKVYVVKDAHASGVTVNVSSFSDQSVCVQGDLNLGDHVVISGAAYLYEGQELNSIQVKDI
ncbi:efflux RND transporter periplasmic adaptor subunit [Vibrio kagoshimensis]|uniref:efflux RND transporter periplasmic adaptor subunit n=1 Tax=Vibrio kagoshimensis TaxID=2910244 RepID=UPI003D215A28